MKSCTSAVFTKARTSLNGIDVTSKFKGRLTFNFLTLAGFLCVLCLQAAQAEVIDIDFNNVPLPNGYDQSTCWEMYSSVWNYYYKTEFNGSIRNYVSTISSPCIDPAALPPGPIVWTGGQIFNTFNSKYKHPTSVSVNAGTFCRLYLPDPAGGADIMTSSRPDVVLVGHLRDGRTITARATQPVNSFISISAPPGTEFNQAEVYPDQNSTPCSAPASLFVPKIQIQTADPDLAVLTPIVTQNGSTTGSDGVQNVSIGSAQVKIPVTGANLDPVWSQTVAVMLTLSTQSPQVQYIPLADIQSGKVSSVTFNVTFQSLDIGTETISAIVAPGNTINESNFSNNTATVQVKVNANALKPTLTISNTTLTQAVNNFALPGSPAQVDLVQGKSTAAIFDVSVANGSTSDPTPVTITIDLGDGSAPVTYPTSLTVGQIVSSGSNQDGLPSSKSTKTIRFSMPPLIPSVSGGPYSVTFKASASGIPNAIASKTVRVKKTNPLEIVYSTFSNRTIGIPTITPADYASHVTGSNLFMKGAFPVAKDGLTSIGGDDLPASSAKPLLAAAIDDIAKLILTRTLADRKARNAIGIVPDAYFQYHDRPDVKGYTLARPLNKVGLSSFVPAASLVQAGSYTVTAHEILHTFGLLDLDNPPQVDGYWVDMSLPISGLDDLMGPGSDLSGVNLHRDWLSANEYSTIFQSLLNNLSDPQVIIISGTIDKSGAVKLQPTYYFADGLATPFDSDADGVVRAIAADGTALAQASFVSSFDLITDTGEDIPTNSTAFLVQLPLSQGAAAIQILQNGNVLTSFNPNAQLLKDAINAIPDQGFDKNPSQRRNALLNKVGAFTNALASGSNQGPLNMLQNDIRKSVSDWVLDSYSTSSSLQLQKAQVLATIDIIASQLSSH